MPLFVLLFLLNWIRCMYTNFILCVSYKSNQTTFSYLHPQVFQIQVSWTDGTKFYIFRCYNKFYSFHVSTHHWWHDNSTLGLYTVLPPLRFHFCITTSECFKHLISPTNDFQNYQISVHKSSHMTSDVIMTSLFEEMTSRRHIKNVTSDIL